MDIAVLIPAWLDAFLIAPFRWFAHPQLGFWLGCTFLCGYCVLLGEATAALLFWCNRGYYAKLQDKMVHAHNLSRKALHAGNKEAYTAVNKMAHEHFGKAFFAQSAVSMASLWPLPFAFAWLALRFDGVSIVTLPLVQKDLGYVFVLLILYIPARIFFSRIRKHLPLFRQVDAYMQKAREARGAMRSFLSAEPSATASVTLPAPPCVLTPAVPPATASTTIPPGTDK